MTTTLAIRRSTILADARGGALSGLSHLSDPSRSPREDERVVGAARLVAAAARVRVGTSADVRVGAGGATAAMAGIVFLVAAGAQGIFSYALFKGGGWVFEKKHPVWGVLFALGTMSSLTAAGSTMLVASVASDGTKKDDTKGT